MRDQHGADIRERATMAVQDLVKPRFGSELDVAVASIQEAADVIERMERIWADLEPDTRPLHYARDHGLTPFL